MSSKLSIKTVLYFAHGKFQKNIHFPLADPVHPLDPGSPTITCYRELGGSGNSEVNNGRQIRLGAVFILFNFQLTSTIEI